MCCHLRLAICQWLPIMKYLGFIVLMWSVYYKGLLMIWMIFLLLQVFFVDKKPSTFLISHFSFLIFHFYSFKCILWPFWFDLFLQINATFWHCLFKREKQPGTLQSTVSNEINGFNHISCPYFATFCNSFSWIHWFICQISCLLLYQCLLIQKALWESHVEVINEVRQISIEITGWATNLWTIAFNALNSWWMYKIFFFNACLNANLIQIVELGY